MVFGQNRKFHFGFNEHKEDSFIEVPHGVYQDRHLLERSVNRETFESGSAETLNAFTKKNTHDTYNCQLNICYSYFCKQCASS